MPPRCPWFVVCSARHWLTIGGGACDGDYVQRGWIGYCHCASYSERVMCVGPMGRRTCLTYCAVPRRACGAGVRVLPDIIYMHRVDREVKNTTPPNHHSAEGGVYAHFPVPVSARPRGVYICHTPSLGSHRWSFTAWFIRAM